MKQIYTLKDPDSHQVRYVGASQNAKTRFKMHIKDAQKGRTTKQIWIKTLLSRGKLPILEIITTEENDARAREIEEEMVIKHINTVFNIHLPGKGHSSVTNYRKTGEKRIPGRKNQKNAQ